MNRFQFVADHQARYGVKRLCQIIGVARSSFYYWRATAAAGPPATPRTRRWPTGSGRSTPTPTAPTACHGSPPSCATTACRSTTSGSPG